jgi:hypothetical protein
VSDPPNRDDETPALRGILPVRERVRAAGVKSSDQRDQLGLSKRDTAEFTAPDEWGETTGVRERRELEERVTALEAGIVDIHGKSGTNGKLGKVTDKVRLVLWAAGVLVVAAIGGVGTVIHTARASGEETGRLRQQVERAAADIADLRQSVWDLARGTSSQPKGPVP